MLEFHKCIAARLPVRFFECNSAWSGHKGRRVHSPSFRYRSMPLPQSITLCIRTLRGRSLRHPSFVAVVHHSFTEINLYCSPTVVYVLHNMRSTYVQSHQSDIACVYHPVSVLKINRKNHAKTQNFCSYYCICC